MTGARQQDITIEQGADFGGAFDLPASLDLEGLDAAMQIRAAYGYPHPLLTLTLSGGGLILDAEARTIRPIIGARTASAFLPGMYVYDVVTRESDGRKTRTHQGSVVVSAAVTVFEFAAELAALLYRGGGYIMHRGGGRILLRV